MLTLRRALTLAVAIVCSMGVGPQTQKAKVEIAVISCPADAASSIKLAARMAGKNGLSAPAVNASAVKLGFNTDEMMLPQGNYLISVSGLHCSRTIQASVISGKTRALSIATRTRDISTYPNRNAIGGRLPFQPAAGWLVGQDGSKRVLDLQNAAYYLERVYPGKYELRFELHGGLRSEVPVDLSKIGYYQQVIRDVSADEFRKHLGPVLQDGTTLEQCEWCP